MRIVATLLLAAAILPAASAQDTATQCQWIGNIWSCDSKTREKPDVRPIDQGSALQSGAAMVPKYEPRRKSEQFERDDFFEGILSACIDGTDIARLPEDRRAITSAMCYAYAKGKASR